MRVTCPECGCGDKITVCETFTGFHDVVCLDDKHLKLVSAHNGSAGGFDDGACDFEFHCYQCGHDWPLELWMEVEFI